MVRANDSIMVAWSSESVIEMLEHESGIYSMVP